MKCRSFEINPIPNIYIQIYLYAALDSRKFMVNKDYMALDLAGYIGPNNRATTIIKRKYFAPGSSHDSNKRILQI